MRHHWPHVQQLDAMRRDLLGPGEIEVRTLRAPEERQSWLAALRRRAGRREPELRPDVATGRTCAD
jgi:hypothetical protein